MRSPVAPYTLLVRLIRQIRQLAEAESLVMHSGFRDWFLSEAAQNEQKTQLLSRRSKKCTKLNSSTKKASSGSYSAQEVVAAPSVFCLQTRPALLKVTVYLLGDV